MFFFLSSLPELRIGNYIKTCENMAKAHPKGNKILDICTYAHMLHTSIVLYINEQMIYKSNMALDARCFHCNFTQLCVVEELW